MSCLFPLSILDKFELVKKVITGATGEIPVIGSISNVIPVALFGFVVLYFAYKLYQEYIDRDYVTDPW